MRAHAATTSAASASRSPVGGWRVALRSMLALALLAAALVAKETSLVLLPASARRRGGRLDTEPAARDHLARGGEAGRGGERLEQRARLCRRWGRS